MPNKASAKKRVRQNEKRRLHNRSLKSEVKTFIKRVNDAVQARDAALAEKELRLAASRLDKLAKRNIWHPNSVSRKKAQLARLVATLETTSGAEPE
jgi:small subunit ribosomal protein S20